MKKKTVWYLVAVLILGLALLAGACAKPAETPAAPTAPVKEAPVVPAAPAKPAATPAATPTGPPAIPHSLEGRDSCLVCHETGMAGAPKIPADHAGRTNEMCRACHQPAPVK